MQLTDIMMAAAIAASVAGVAYAELNPDDMAEPARKVAAAATCRTVNSAIVAYAAIYDQDPKSIADLSALVDGDITAYRIVAGAAAGPGC